MVTYSFIRYFENVLFYIFKYKKLPDKKKKIRVLIFEPLETPNYVTHENHYIAWVNSYHRTYFLF